MIIERRMMKRAAAILILIAPSLLACSAASEGSGGASQGSCPSGDGQQAGKVSIGELNGAWRMCDVAPGKYWVRLGGQVGQVEVANGRMRWTQHDYPSEPATFLEGPIDEATRVWTADIHYSGRVDGGGWAEQTHPAAVTVTFSADGTRFRGTGPTEEGYPTTFYGAREDGSFECTEPPSK